MGNADAFLLLRDNGAKLPRNVIVRYNITTNPALIPYVVEELGIGVVAEMVVYAIWGDGTSLNVFKAMLAHVTSPLSSQTRDSLYDSLVKRYADSRHSGFFDELPPLAVDKINLLLVNPYFAPLLFSLKGLPNLFQYLEYLLLSYQFEFRELYGPCFHLN